jgi:hypothetical protein
VRVDALVKAHMLHVASQMVGLQEALASSGICCRNRTMLYKLAMY